MTLAIPFTVTDHKNRIVKDALILLDYPHQKKGEPLDMDKVRTVLVGKLLKEGRGKGYNPLKHKILTIKKEDIWL
jgi:hypothetical protein